MLKPIQEKHAEGWKNYSEIPTMRMLGAAAAMYRVCVTFQHQNMSRDGSEVKHYLTLRF